jgi:ribosomal protein S18 acetylase RimI-like enzyme
MSAVEIEIAGPDRARTIAELHSRSFRAAYEHLPVTRRSAESGLEGRVVIWDERLRRSERTSLVAVEGGRVVGFIHFGHSPDDDADETTGHIFSVHVDPDLTGRGIGGQLIEAAVSHLSMAGYRTATLWALGGNEQALRFYCRRGWRSDGAARTEKLSVGQEEGNEVEVVRLRLEHAEMAEGAHEISHL